MIAVDTNFLVYAHREDSSFHKAAFQALCRQHGVRELWSADRDFSRFAGLTVVNPLVGPE
jgi:predicted nucleic acid-binding protein